MFWYKIAKKILAVALASVNSDICSFFVLWAYLLVFANSVTIVKFKQA